IDATPLLENDGKPFAPSSGFLDVFGNVAEGDGEPLLLVQAVIADLDGKGGQGQSGVEDKCGKNGSEHGCNLYPMDWKTGNVSSSQKEMIDICPVMKSTPVRIKSPPISISTLRICFLNLAAQSRKRLAKIAATRKGI